MNGASEECRHRREWSRAVEEEPAHQCKDESMAKVSPGGDRKKTSGGNGDTLGRDALKRADIAVCEGVSSCSLGQEWWRTELELHRGESFHDGHGPTALGTAPQGLGGRCGRGFRFGLRWHCVESSEAQRQESSAPSIGEEAEVADADEAPGEQVK